MGSLSALDLFSFALGSLVDIFVSDSGSASELEIFAGLS
ncbi:hypothetical protein C8K36_108159 [Rhodococcus sp. OK519]|nr:hypothetical protein C8K36_108159 [Rhodococcus sp. OK519]